MDTKIIVLVAIGAFLFMRSQAAPVSTLPAASSAPERGNIGDRVGGAIGSIVGGVVEFVQLGIDEGGQK